MRNNILLILLILLASFYAFGKEIRVLVVDTGVDITSWKIRSHVNIAKWTDSNYSDQNGHGTHVSGIILRNTCDEVQLISCKYFNQLSGYNGNLDKTIECFKQAVKEHVDIVNYSSGGKAPSDEEIKVIKEMGLNGIILNTAAGNDGQDLSKPYNVYYPAKYDLPNVNVIGNLDTAGKRAKTSNYGLKNMRWEVGTQVWSILPYGNYGYMSGTSQATAVFTNKMLLKMCKENHGR